MQEDFRLIIDFVTVLAAAATGGLFAALLRQPPLLGYLIGGMLVGPAGLGLIKELIQIETLAQFGVAFLLFALGVEFSLAELRKVQKIALGGGGLQITLTILITVAVCGLTGAWATLPAKGMFLGAILSLSSTAVVLKCLLERNETETPHGQVMLGILVVQDLALGLMLAVLPALDQPPEAIGKSLLYALLQIAGFVAGALIVGKWMIPPLLRLLARTESREIFLLGVVGICLTIALLTAYMGLSIEMGAFVAGLMISEVEYADQTLSYVEPVRDIFAALFFAAIGMLIDPVFLISKWELILGLVCLVTIGKFLVVTPIVKLFGYPLKTAIIAGLGLAQIGEFSFVLASEGQILGLVSRQVYLLILGTTAVTLVLTPFLLQFAPKLLELPWIKPLVAESDLPLAMAEELPKQNHVVVCGYGKVGRNLVKLLQDNQYPVVVIDQSEQRIQKLRDSGVSYVYGNAASLHVLEAAGISQARGMAIALPDPISSRLCLKRALELSPDLDIVVRAGNDKDIELFYQLGAREVVQPEFEASLEVATHLLSGSNLANNAIQRQMQQIRSNHYLALRPERSPSELAREVQAAAQEMDSQWYDLDPLSPLVGMTLEESDLRRLTGVSLVAIRRSQGVEIDYPESQTMLEAGDRLLMVGSPAEIDAFHQLATGEVAFPGESSPCQWVMIPSDSPAVGQTLASLDIRRQYGVQIQAIRRDAKFIRFPGGDVELMAGDQLLLCGGSHPLGLLRQWMVPLINEPPSLPIPVLKVPVSEALQEFLPADQE